MHDHERVLAEVRDPDGRVFVLLERLWAGKIARPMQASAAGREHACIPAKGETGRDSGSVKGCGCYRHPNNSLAARSLGTTSGQHHDRRLTLAADHGEKEAASEPLAAASGARE